MASQGFTSAQSDGLSLNASPGSMEYVLHVIKANFIASSSDKRNKTIYAEIELPKKKVLTQTIKKAPVSEWNAQYKFTAQGSFTVTIRVREIRSFKSDRYLGVSQATVEHLQGFSGNDAVLDLFDPETIAKTGTLTIRLIPNASAKVDFQTTQEKLQSLRLDLESDDGSTEQSEELQYIQGILLRLQALEKMIKVIDEVSKIHPYIAAAWSVVSSLYKAYGKKVSTDKAIVKLISQMEKLLSFAEDSQTLKETLMRFTDTLTKALVAIQECCEAIRKYIQSSTPSQTWQAFSNAESLEDFQSRFDELHKVLSSNILIHTARRTDAISSKIDNIMSSLIPGPPDSGSPETHQRPKASNSVIPPLPSELFTGRETLLKQMADNFDFTTTSVGQGKQRRFVLFGLGGAGKTQTALKFLDEHRDKFSSMYVIDASTRETIIASLENIGHHENIPDPSSKSTLEWLSRHPEEWILLFDNADDPELNILEFLPRCRHGNIIITSRNRECLLYARDPKSNCEVIDMEMDSAVSLLLSSAGISAPDPEESESMARNLVQQFGCLPLAIVQAGSYIAARGISLEKYLEVYRSFRAELLGHKAAQKSDDYKWNVYTTWDISFQRLSKPAQVFLTICAFLHREGITEELFRNATSSFSHLQQRAEAEVCKDTDIMQGFLPGELEELFNALSDGGTWNQLKFSNLIHELRSYSLIQVIREGEYGVHPLVHAWSRERMNHCDHEAAERFAMVFLFHAMPDNATDTSVYTYLRTLLSHIKANKRDRILEPRIAAQFAIVYMKCERWKEAGEMRERELVLRRTLAGGSDDDSSIATCLGHLGVAYFRQGRFKEAEEVSIQASQISDRTLTVPLPDLIAILTNLAHTYLSLGRRKDAQGLQAYILSKCFERLGMEDPHTIQCMSQLAMMCAQGGFEDEAEYFAKKVVELCYNKFGEMHPDTHQAIRVLSSTYFRLGRLRDAEKQKEIALKISRDIFGTHHPQTFQNMSDLAALYSQQGRYEEAREWHSMVLEIRKPDQGDEHPDTLACACALAETYAELRRWKDAEALFVPLLDSTIRVYGEEHPITLRRMGHLANTHLKLGSWEDAQKLQSDLINRCTRALGEGNPLTIEEIDRMAVLYSYMGRFDEAEQMERRAIDLAKQHLGEDHPTLLTHQGNLGSILSASGRWEEAIKLQTETLERSRAVLGNENLNTLMEMSDLAISYLRGGSWDQGEILERQALEIKKRVLGDVHPETLRSIGLLASIDFRKTNQELFTNIS